MIIDDNEQCISNFMKIFRLVKGHIVAHHDSFLAPIGYNFIPLPSHLSHLMMIRLDQHVQFTYRAVLK